MIGSWRREGFLPRPGPRDVPARGGYDDEGSEGGVSANVRPSVMASAATHLEEGVRRRLWWKPYKT